MPCVAAGATGISDAVQPPALWTPLLQQPNWHHRRPAVLWTPGLQCCKTVQAHVALCVRPVDLAAGSSHVVGRAAMGKVAQAGATRQQQLAAVARVALPGARAEEMSLESVKRKRQRKMNKHKHRKRLKKLRMGKLR